MTAKPLESKIETYLKQQIKRIGGLCYKFKSTVSGVPDQLVIFNGTMHLVEVKRPGETPRPNQVHVHGQIEKQGVPVHTVDTKETVDAFIQNVLHVQSANQSTICTTDQTIHVKPKGMFNI